MLEQYFFKPETIDQIRNAWLGKPIEHYVEWMAGKGYSERTVYRRVPMVRQFGEFAQRGGAKKFDDLPTYIEPFIQYWVKKHGRKCKTGQALRNVAKEIRTPVEQLLCLILPDFVGRGRQRTTKDPFVEQAPSFFAYLCEERGLRKTSILHYRHFLGLFQKYLEKIELSKLAELSPAILSGFVTENGPKLCKTSMVSLCCTLRVFLRYLFQKDLVERDLSGTVEAPRKYQLTNIPRSITWEQVRRMLETVDCRTVLGKRDYAILLLLVTYGLRGCEVASLSLDHIDWTRERILVPERKAGHTTSYPLSSIVGEAILDYLQNGRPETNDRHIFFRVIAPKTTLTPNTVSNRATHYLRKAGINVRRPGSHTLRHTCVQRLVDADFSFKVIGDYVAHSSPSSTKIYSKISVEHLRDVALAHGESWL